MLCLKFSLETMKGTTGQKQRAKQTKNSTHTSPSGLLSFCRNLDLKTVYQDLAQYKTKREWNNSNLESLNFCICREFLRSVIPFSMERPFGKKQRKHISRHRRFPKAQLTFLETERCQVSLVWAIPRNNKYMKKPQNLITLDFFCREYGSRTNIKEHHNK